jgi:hypothetical protein
MLVVLLATSFQSGMALGETSMIGHILAAQLEWEED